MIACLSGFATICIISPKYKDNIKEKTFTKDVQLDLANNEFNFKNDLVNNMIHHT